MNLLKYPVHLFLIIFYLGISITNSYSQEKTESDVPVKTYNKKDGTIVPKHFRTKPNYTNRDNFTTEGNTNPYNGKKGTIKPDSKRLRSSDLTFQEYSRSDNNPYDENPFFTHFPESSIGIHSNINGLGMDISYRKRNNVFGVGYQIDMSSYSVDVSQSSPNYVDFWKVFIGKRIVKNLFIKGVGGIKTNRDNYYSGSRFVYRKSTSFYKGVGLFGVYGEGNLSFVPEISFDEYWGIGFGFGFTINL